jgi:tRNA nucleotidyltransferase/poly(A) polymerase
MAETPAALLEICARLESRGRRAWLVGESLHDLRLGLPVRAWELATTAPAGDLLAAFPRAVPIDPRRGVVMVPTAAGPADLAPLGFGASPSHDLARRDFSVLAMAFDPLSGSLCDPYDGEGDRDQRLLRGVGNARERLAEDPLRALRALRLVAEHGYRLDGELAEAMEDIAPQVTAVAPYRLRRELVRLLLAPGCREALELARRTGIEAALVEGVREDAAALTARVPAKLAIRLAAWLRGAGAAVFLRNLRFGMPLSREVLLRLDHHPIEGAVRASHDPAVRRLLGRLDARALDELFALREAELRGPDHAPERPGAAGSGDLRREAQRDLTALRAAIERVRAHAERARHREALAALRFLAERVSDDPACNEPERLQALLQDWRRAHPE